MKNGKPKGKSPSLIGGALGAPRKGIMARTRPCTRCACALAKGTECIEIPQLRNSFRPYKPYCFDCFKAILEKTTADLKALFADFFS
jgi:hypothetical protein